MIAFTAIHPLATLAHFGHIPSFLVESDPRPAREQFNDRYGPGGGWRPTTQFKLGTGGKLYYPGDPPIHPLAQLQFRKERIVLYEHEIIAIFQEDGSFEAARMD